MYALQIDNMTYIAVYLHTRPYTKVTVISLYAARNRLRAARLRARRPYKDVYLTQRHWVARLDWAHRHCLWVRQRWDRVVFTDECKFKLNWAGGRFRVWRRRGERQDHANVVECDGNGGGSVMVWGRISLEGKTELTIVRGRLNAANYCADIILPAVVPCIHSGNADVFSRIMHVVILLFLHVTSWRQTTLPRSNGLPNHQICHMKGHLGR